VTTKPIAGPPRTKASIVGVIPAIKAAIPFTISFLESCVSPPLERISDLRPSSLFSGFLFPGRFTEKLLFALPLALFYVGIS